MNDFSKVFFLIVLSLLLLQCGPDYQTNKRVLIKGQLQNDTGEPMRNIDVSAFTLTDDYFQGNQQNGYLLGRNKSQEDGSFAVICLLDVDSDFFITVNGIEDYIDYSYVFKTDFSEPEDLVVDMGTVTLRKRANVTFNLSRTSPAGTSIDFIISYENPFCAVVYEDDSLMSEESTCFERTTFTRSFDGNSENFSSSFNSVLGSDVTIIYSIDNQPEETETFTIDQSNFTYEFTY